MRSTRIFISEKPQLGEAIGAVILWPAFCIPPTSTVLHLGEKEGHEGVVTARRMRIGNIVKATRARQNSWRNAAFQRTITH